MDKKLPKYELKIGDVNMDALTAVSVVTGQP